MANEYRGVSAILPFTFYINLDTSKLAAADTDYNLPVPGGFDDDDGRLVMAFDGCLVGISLQHHEAIAAADAGIVKVLKGTTVMCQETITKAADTAQYVRYQPDSQYAAVGDRVFAAGDMLSVKAQADLTADDFGETTVTVFVQVGRSGT